MPRAAFLRGATIIAKEQEVSVARRGGYRSDKRRKETDRLKKQEEKRQRRFNRGRGSENDPESENVEEGPVEEMQEEESVEETE